MDIADKPDATKNPTPLPSQEAGAVSGSSSGKRVAAPPDALRQKLEFVAFGRFLYEEINIESLRPDESDTYPKHKRLFSLILKQTYVIIALVLTVIVAQPYLRPAHSYYARGEGTKNIPLAPLLEPNMTDKAVLSWVETSITEIMTFGFGDFDRRILSQKHRFTKLGWDSFLDSVRKQNLRSEFKLRQLVLTTAPSDAPVIVSKGIDIDQNYTWTIQMPVVMTYITNNNVRSGRKSVVSVTVARLPATESVRGIGIKKWHMY